MTDSFSGLQFRCHATCRNASREQFRLLGRFHGSHAQFSQLVSVGFAHEFTGLRAQVSWDRPTNWLGPEIFISAPVHYACNKIHGGLH
jgi:hypothetical protein